MFFHWIIEIHRYTELEEGDEKQQLPHAARGEKVCTQRMTKAKNGVGQRDMKESTKDFIYF